MTPEELAEADKLAREGSIARIFLDHIDSQVAQIEALKVALLESCAQEVQFGQSYIKWRYITGFDSLDYDAQLKEAIKKAKAELRGDGMLEKAGVTWDE